MFTGRFFPLAVIFVLPLGLEVWAQLKCYQIFFQLGCSLLSLVGCYDAWQLENQGRRGKKTTEVGALGSVALDFLTPNLYDQKVSLSHDICYPGVSLSLW